MQCVFAETLALVYFTFIGGLAVYAGASNIVAISLAHGLTLSILITNIGSISGGHLNPIVTLAMLLLRRITILKAIGYFVGQLIGAICGGLLIRGSLSFHNYLLINGGAMHISLGGPTGILPIQAVVLEMMMTSFLVFTVLMNDKPGLVAAFQIGLSVSVDILAGGLFSGASMNIARSFGPLVAYTICTSQAFNSNATETVGMNSPALLWKNHWVHWVGPIVGSLCALAIFKIAFQSSSRRQQAVQEESIAEAAALAARILYNGNQKQNNMPAGLC